MTCHVQEDRLPALKSLPVAVESSDRNSRSYLANRESPKPAVCSYLPTTCLVKKRKRNSSAMTEIIGRVIEIIKFLIDYFNEISKIIAIIVDKTNPR
jgi:hypothetical protein